MAQAGSNYEASQRALNGYTSFPERNYVADRDQFPEKEFFNVDNTTGVNRTYSVLRIDIETYSETDISAGVYRYVQDPSFEVLLFAYRWQNDPIKIVDIACGEKIPAEILALLINPFCRKVAYNANFERVCLAEWLRLPMYPDQWHCTQAQGLLAGFPAGLDYISKALGLEGKNKDGKALIRFFSIPVKPTKANGFQTRNYPEFWPEKWQAFKDYCIQDVEAEQAVGKAIPNFLKGKERELWIVDQMINDKGISIDRPFVEACAGHAAQYVSAVKEDAAELTGLDNPGSNDQMKAWIAEELGLVEVGSLAKDKVGEVIELAKQAGAHHVVQVLELRAESSKSSIKKYDTMLKCVCNDDRVRGLFQYAGASRTHRWAGRNIQIQNLRKNSMSGLFEARDIAREGSLEMMELLYGDVADVLSQLIRTSFVAVPRKTFVVADFSAIEARVIAWLAQEKWRIETFAGEGLIYEASAAMMFRVPVESIAYMKGGEKIKGPNYHLRAKGKISELACGFQGGTNALIRMGALEGGLREDELPQIVSLWRAASPRIVALWKAVENAAIKCVETGLMQSVRMLVFRIEGTALTITLPSGRKLVYQSPTLRPNKFGGRSLSYWGSDGGHWARQNTYGGSLVENCIFGGELILTNFGWARLDEVTTSHLLWDGTEWVSHQGLVYKGEQQTIDIDGVEMTPDHKILTEDGWKAASQSQEHKRAEVALPDGYPMGRVGRNEIAMGNTMRLREDRSHACKRVQQRQAEILRLQMERAYSRKEQDAWYEPQSFVRGMALDDRPLQAANTPSMAQLRGKRYQRMPKLARIIREFLGVGNAQLRAGVDLRSKRRRRKLRTGELQMGELQRAGEQQAQQPQNKYSVGGNDRNASGRKSRLASRYCSRTDSSGVAGGKVIGAGRKPQPVYDLVNAGPRHRFTVLGDNGPFIVHNCVQSIARDCLAESLLRLCSAGFDTVAHIHDEVIVEVFKNVIDGNDTDLAEIIRLMEIPMPWAQDLLLKADGYVTPIYYKKD